MIENPPLASQPSSSTLTVAVNLNPNIFAPVMRFFKCTVSNLQSLGVFFKVTKLYIQMHYLS